MTDAAAPKTVDYHFEPNDVRVTIAVLPARPQKAPDGHIYPCFPIVSGNGTYKGPNGGTHKFEIVPSQGRSGIPDNVLWQNLTGGKPHSSHGFSATGVVIYGDQGVLSWAPPGAFSFDFQEGDVSGAVTLKTTTWPPKF